MLVVCCFLLVFPVLILFDCAWYNIQVLSQKCHRLVASCQFYRLVEACQQVNCLVNFIKLQQSCYNQACCNLSFAGLLQLVETICNKPVKIINLQQTCWNNKLATSLLTTFNRLAVTSCGKSCDRILTSACCNKLLQDVNRLVTTCAYFAVYAAAEKTSMWARIFENDVIF